MKIVLKAIIIYLVFFCGILQIYAQNMIIPPTVLGDDLMGNVTESQWTSLGGTTLSYNSIEGGFPIITDTNGLTNHEGWQNSICCNLSVNLKPSKTYQFVLKIKSDVFPCGQNVVITVEDIADHTQSVEYTHNVSKAGTWEYVYIPVISKTYSDWKVKFIYVQPLTKYGSTLSTIYIAPDVDVYELPNGTEAANLQSINTATDKDSFESSTQKVDIFGNFYVKSQNDTLWAHVFPKMMYKGYDGSFYPADSVYYNRYKDYGFNGTMDVWTAAEAQAALNAGMDYVSISSGSDINYYWNQVNNWADVGNHHKNIIWYNFDNENANIADYDFQEAMGIWANSHFLDPITNRRRHPIYFLNGQYGLPRTYHNNNRDVMDITGTYVGTSNAIGSNDYMNVRPNMLCQFLTQNQRSPAFVIQLQSYFEESFIPSLFYGIIMGGRALSVWRDGTNYNTNGPDFRQCYWADAFKNEVSGRLDQMLPIIEQPQFTTWKARTTEFPNVRIGSRELNDTAYLILANFDSVDVISNVNIQGKKATEAVDFFTGNHIADIVNDTFQFTIGHFNNGYRVIKLVDTLTMSLKETSHLNIPVNIYPNPTSNFITIIIETKDFEKLSWILFDMGGKLLESNDVTKKETKVDLKNLKSGTYILVLKKGNVVIKSSNIFKSE